ncbi:MAG: hypothetical protein JNM00_08680, partial [Flavobacteriales bacterium]|nr:hypothetical protein [Flavobacteriales bacterium]
MNRFLIALAASSLSLISNAQAPQYAWHKTFGGTIAEAAIGNDGYVYVIGTWTGLRDFDPGPGTLNLTSSASGTKQAVFFGRFTQTGDLVWIKSLPSAAYASYGVAITTDADNNLLLLLQSNDNDFDSDAGDGVVQHLLGESYVGGDYYAGIVARYDVDGNYLWSQPIIREGYTGVYVEDVVTDGTYVYVTGSAAAYYWGGWVTYGDGPDCGCYLFTPSGFSAEDAGFAVAWALDNGDAIPTNTGIST